MSKLLEAISEATAEDLAAVDEEIRELEQKLAGLREVARVLRVTLFGKPPRKSPARKPKPAAAAGADGGKPDATSFEDELRQEIHDTLTKFGPMKPGAIGVEIGQTAQYVGRLTAHEWFRKDTEGVVHIA